MDLCRYCSDLATKAQEGVDGRPGPVLARPCGPTRGPTTTESGTVAAMPLTRGRRWHIWAAPDGRTAAARLRRLVEESPGSTGIRCRLTAGGGDPRESATENKPPALEETPAGKGETVRQERTAPPATGAAGQTPPGARPNRGGRRSEWGKIPCRRRRDIPVPSPGLVARGAQRCASQRNGRPRSQGLDRTRLTGRLAPLYIRTRCTR